MTEPLTARFLSKVPSVRLPWLGFLIRVQIGHWIWWIFPQAKGLGRSDRSKRCGIGCLDEAVIYLAHRPLGDRYCQIVDAAWWQVTQCRTPVRTLFGRDAKKFVSSLTLFQRAAEKCIAAQIPEF